MVKDAEEVVEFDVPAKWSAEQTEQFAARLVERITSAATAKLVRLREKSTSLPPPNAILALLEGDVKTARAGVDPRPDVVAS